MSGTGEPSKCGLEEGSIVSCFQDLRMESVLTMEPQDRCHLRGIQRS